MSREHKKRRAQQHELYKDVAYAIEKFLNMLLKHHEGFEWAASRSSDILRLETVKSGFFIRFLHIVGKNHPDYVKLPIQSPSTGNCIERFELEVRNWMGQCGRRYVMQEEFYLDSPLSDLAEKVFREIRKGKKFLLPRQETMPKRAVLINEVTKLLAA